MQLDSDYNKRYDWEPNTSNVSPKQLTRLQRLGRTAGVTAGLILAPIGFIHAANSGGEHVEQPAVINTTVPHDAYTVKKDGTGPTDVIHVVEDAFPAPNGVQPDGHMTEQQKEVSEVVVETLNQEGHSSGLMPGQEVALPDGAAIGHEVPGDPQGVK